MFTVRIGRIELPPHPWQGRVLPLNYIRLCYLRDSRLPPRVIFAPAWSGATKNSFESLPAGRQGLSCVKQFTHSVAGAPGGIRTPNNGSEDRCDIHFTTGALKNNIANN